MVSFFEYLENYQCFIDDFWYVGRKKFNQQVHSRGVFRVLIDNCFFKMFLSCTTFIPISLNNEYIKLGMASKIVIW